MYPRYPATSMSLQVTGYTYEKTAAATKRVVAVQILTTGGTGARCVTGDKGTLTLQGVGGEALPTASAPT